MTKRTPAAQVSALMPAQAPAPAPAPASPPALPESGSRHRYRLIHDHLERAISAGRISPGLVLLEGPLARVFGTSRVPVRKAFELLHAKGLLHTFDGRGYLVADPNGAATRTPAPLRAPLSETALGFDSPPAPLDLPTTGERVYHEIREAVSVAIIFGHFRIDESMAAEAFHVSRGVVREALTRLRDFGLVEKSAYSHWLCGPLTARAVAQDYELRVLLEPAALRLSQPYLQHEMLTGAIAEIGQAIAHPAQVNTDALQQIEATLHGACLAHTTNHKLLDTIRRAHMPLTVNHAFYNAFNLRPEPAMLDEHRTVLRHLVAGDVERASAALHAHLHAAQARTLQRLKVLSVLPEPELPAFVMRFP